MNKLKKFEPKGSDTKVSAKTTLDSTFQTSPRILLDSTFQPSARIQFTLLNQTMNQKPYELVSTSKFKEDIVYWQKTNPKIYKKIRNLVKDTKFNPFEGIGNPKPLKYFGSNAWSRRINQEHRLVYKVQDNQITLIQARYHY